MKKLKAESIAADRGFDAAMAEKKRDENPYDPHNPLYKWWEIGWLEFQDETTNPIP
jgi:ribosome modulation factor